MSLRWRAVRKDDLAECLAIDPRSVGDRLVGRRDALKIWHGLLANPSFNSAAIEMKDSSGGSKIVSFGASVFLRSDYVDRELACLEPDLNSRVFAGLRAGESPLCSTKSLTSQHEADTLDLLLLSSSFLMDELSPAMQEAASLLLPQCLVHLHAGYRVRRIVMETTQEWMRLLMLSSGLWRLLAHFPEEERAFLVVTREGALNAANFTGLVPMFQHRAPKLGLRNPEKQLLCEAIHGATDAELADELSLSLSSVKKRWSTLYLRVAGALPELLPDDVRDSTGRGPQKRHRVLAYVRDHPEELRPYRWYPRA